MTQVHGINRGLPVFGLVSGMEIATKVVKVADLHHLKARNFDKSEHLIKACSQEKPCLIILDGEKCEAESFNFLKAYIFNADLKSVPVVGFVSNAKRALKAELERAGALKIYLKTQFLRELDGLIMRYSE